MAIVLVAGTNSWGNNDAVDWYVPAHAFAKYLESHGLEVMSDSGMPFIWSTDLDGVVLDRKNHTDWSAAGAALSYFVRMHGVDEVDIITHSHGLQVVIFAIAHYGLRVRRLVSVGSPVRKDMEYLSSIAKQNIGKWLHIYSDKSDRWQWLGELFDGRLGIVRKHPLADRNDFVAKVGHSEILRDPSKYPLWIQNGWIDFLKGIDNASNENSAQTRLG